MLTPKKLKHRKVHRGRSRFKGVATQRNELNFGTFGLKSNGHAWITSRQIESARRAMTRFIKRGGKIWIRIFPDKPITKKGEQQTMGSGKGSLDHFASVVKPGTILFEMDGVEQEVAKRALELAAHKLPIKTKFVIKD